MTHRDRDPFRSTDRLTGPSTGPLSGSALGNHSGPSQSGPLSSVRTQVRHLAGQYSSRLMLQRRTQTLTVVVLSVLVSISLTAFVRATVRAAAGKCDTAVGRTALPSGAGIDAPPGVHVGPQSGSQGASEQELPPGIPDEWKVVALPAVLAPPLMPGDIIDVVSASRVISEAVVVSAQVQGARDGTTVAGSGGGAAGGAPGSSHVALTVAAPPSAAAEVATAATIGDVSVTVHQ